MQSFGHRGFIISLALLLLPYGHWYQAQVSSKLSSPLHADPLRFGKSLQTVAQALIHTHNKPSGPGLEDLLQVLVGDLVGEQLLPPLPKLLVLSRSFPDNRWERRTATNKMYWDALKYTVLPDWGLEPALAGKITGSRKEKFSSY